MRYVIGKKENNLSHLLVVSSTQSIAMYGNTQTGMSYITFFKLSSYLQYNVVTDFVVVNQAELEFPAVTICNANRVHCGNLHNFILTCEKVSFMCSSVRKYAQLCLS